MSIIKIQQGDTIHFTVTSIVRDVPSNNPKYKPQHKFIGSTPDDPDAAVFMSTASAERQLGRLGLTLDTVVGQTIEFAKPGEYVDINRPSGAVPAPRAAAPVKQGFSSGGPIAGLDDARIPFVERTPRPIATPEYGDVPAQQKAVDAITTVDRLDRMFKVYGAIESHILATSVKKFEDAKVGASPESVAAQIATLFIQACNKGIAA
jgi:hypothetical protein